MNIDSAIGNLLVRGNGEENVLVSAHSREAIVSLLDGIELIGGAFGEDDSFDASRIVFDDGLFSVSVSRAQLDRWFEYEILNFLK